MRLVGAVRAHVAWSEDGRRWRGNKWQGQFNASVAMMDLPEAKRILAALEREGDYRMQKNTVRPQDRLDAETIRRQFGLPEE